MRKRDELTDPASCMSRARPDELTFVLLGRDAAAPAAIRAWIAERVRLGKNRPGDTQLVEAEQCARVMEAERAAPPGNGTVFQGTVRSASEGDWGHLPAEPCRFCRRPGGVHFLRDDGPEGRSAGQIVRCDRCGRDWVADTSAA